MDELRTLCNRVFGTPDVQVTIFRQSDLTPRDLANAACVNRSWFNVVQPFLWENVQIMPPSNLRSTVSETGFLRHAQHIKTFTTSCFNVVNWLADSPLGVHLAQLEVVDKIICTSMNSQSIYMILLRNPGLKTFRLHLHRKAELAPLVVKGLMELEPGQLTTLDFGQMRVNQTLTQVLNRFASSLLILILDGCKFTVDTFVNLEPLPHLKKLCVKVNDRWELSPTLVNSLLSLLRSGPNISELDFGIDSTYLALVLTRVMGRTGMQSLINLKVTCLNGKELPDHKTATILESVPTSVQNLTLNRCRFGTSSNEAWSNLVTTLRLVSVKVHCCFGITNQAWLFTVKNSPSLIMIEDSGKIRIDARWVTDPWVCTGLKKLEIHLRVGFESLEGLENECLEVKDNRVLEDCRHSLLRFRTLTCLEVLKLRIEGPRSQEYRKPIQLADKQYQSRSAVTLPERFALLLYLLEPCKCMKEFKAETCLPRRLISIVKLKDVCREIWGEKVAVQICRAVLHQ